MTRSLRIAQIGTVDEGGGAAIVARGLMSGYQRRGHTVRFFVGRKRGRDSAIVVLPDDDRPAWRWTGYAALQRVLGRAAGRFPNRGFGAISRTLRNVTHPRAVVERWSGLEDFNFPASQRVLDVDGRVPDIVHGHNLHGDFFDLRAVASISARVPVVLTLHDMWTFTGHCAHALSCARWQHGCGECPDLRRDPAVRRDRTQDNWRRKRDIFARSRLSLATPSEWLRDQVAKSMLATFETRVIPNGVDGAIFQPGDRAAARARLRWPASAPIVLVTTGTPGSPWKDDRTLRAAIDRVSVERPDVEFVAVGRKSAVHLSRARTRSLAFEHDRATMALYYQAADLYWHAAHADTFPLAVLEAMACGTPVVATRVGGIPEQVDGDSGVLVAAGAAGEMAAATVALLSDEEHRASLGRGAAQRVRQCFTLDRQVDRYLSWHQALVAAA